LKEEDDFDVDGNNQDRMWRVFKANFRGKWLGDIKF